MRKNGNFRTENYSNRNKKINKQGQWQTRKDRRKNDLKNRTIEVMQ